MKKQCESCKDFWSVACLLGRLNGKKKACDNLNNNLLPRFQRAIWVEDAACDRMMREQSRSRETRDNNEFWVINNMMRKRVAEESEDRIARSKKTSKSLKDGFKSCKIGKLSCY